MSSNVICTLVFAIIFLLKVRLSYSACKTVYLQTTCDSYDDINDQSDRQEWTNLQIGSFDGTPNKTVNLQKIAFHKLNRLRVVTVVKHVKAIGGITYGAQCNFYSSKIEEYNYFGNHFPQLTPYTFPVLKLRRMNLIDNGIETIIDGAFFQHQIDILDLTKNKLEIIQKGALSQMPSTKTIILKENLLSSIDPESLPSSLEVLVLDNNKLRYLQDSVLSGLPNLTELSLSHNRFASIPNMALMPSLVIFDVANNDIEKINKNSFDNNPKLQYLDVSHNILNSVPFLESFLREKDEGLRLSLGFNRLRGLDLESFNVTLNNQNIWLYGNPWDCSAWDNIFAKFGTIQDECDRTFFRSGLTPYCLAWSQLFYVFQSDSEKDVIRFVEQIKKNEDNIHCSLKPIKADIYNPPQFGCVA